MKITKIAEKLAIAAFEIGAIKIQPDNPFTWASGLRSPIYNDNRLFLGKHKHLKLVSKGFEALLNKHSVPVNVIAGTATAGIPHSSILAYRLGIPLVYIRDKPKEHGLKNQIEGIGAGEGLFDRNVVVIEDLISTGGSSAAAVQAVIDAGGVVTHCFSIFSYEFPDVTEIFMGKIPFKANKKLSEECMVDSILTYSKLIEIAVAHDFISRDKELMLRSWNANPKKWSEDWIANNPGK